VADEVSLLLRDQSYAVRCPIARSRLPHGNETVSVVNLYADDPKAFMDEVRNHI
jgi:hypothetical protein